MIVRQSNELQIRQVTNLLRRRWSLIGCFALCGAALAGSLGFLLPPRYTAKSQLLYQTEVRDGVEVVDEAAVETLVELLVSPNHLRRLAATLAEEAEQAIALLPPDGPEGAAPAAQAATTVPPPPDFDALEKGLSSYKERKSRLIAVTFTSTDPLMAATVANRAVDLYLDVEAERQKAARAKSLTAIADQLPVARGELKRTEAALRMHQIENGFVESDQANLTDRQIAELVRQLMRARSDLAMRQVRLDSLLGQQSRLDSGGPNQQDRESAAAPDGAAEPGAGSSSDDVLVAAANRLTVLPDTLGGAEGSASAGRALEDLNQDRDAADARLRDIEQRLATLRAASAGTGDAGVRLHELQRESAAAGQIYENLLRRQAELLGQGGASLPARVVSVASVPERSSSPNPLLFILPAIIGAGLIGGLLAILLERLDQRLRSERDVEETLGLACIGLVPQVKRGLVLGVQRLLRDEPFSDYTEAVRSIFVAATRHVPVAGAKTFLVTASDVGEGATTLALSLAVYARRLHRRVLLMDLDFRDSGLTPALEDGPTDPSSGQATSHPSFAIRRSAQLSVDYVSHPHTRLDPLAILSSEEFAQLLTHFQQTYDCIVIDSAPLGSATETRLLASMVDRVILAVRWGVTESRAARAALQQLWAAGGSQAAPVSVVVTRVNMRAHKRYRYGEPGPLLGRSQAQTT